MCEEQKGGLRDLLEDREQAGEGPEGGGTGRQGRATRSLESRARTLHLIPSAVGSHWRPISRGVIPLICSFKDHTACYGENRRWRVKTGRKGAKTLGRQESSER